MVGVRATLANLDATRQWVRTQNASNLEAARSYVAGAGDFPSRAALNLLIGRFLTDYYAMVDNWARWAADVVRDWPADPADAPLDRDALAETARIAAETQRG